MAEVQQPTRLLRRLAVAEALVIVALLMLLIFRGEPVTEVISPEERPETAGASPVGPDLAAPPSVETDSPDIVDTPSRELQGSASPADSAAGDVEELGVVVYGRLTDSSGSPVEWRVMLVSADGVIRTGQSDERGAFSIAGLPPGRYMSRVDASAYSRHEGTVVLDSLDLSGTVTDSSSLPVRGATVNVQPPWGLRPGFSSTEDPTALGARPYVRDSSVGRTWRVQTDEMGRFAFSRIPFVAGTMLSVWHPAFVTHEVSRCSSKEPRSSRSGTTSRTGTRAPARSSSSVAFTCRCE